MLYQHFNLASWIDYQNRNIKYSLTLCKGLVKSKKGTHKSYNLLSLIKILGITIVGNVNIKIERNRFER